MFGLVACPCLASGWYLCVCQGQMCVDPDVSGVLFSQEHILGKMHYNPPACFPQPYIINTAIYRPPCKINAPNLACNSSSEYFCLLL